MSIQKAIKSITISVLFAIGVVSFSMPAQAAMVGTAQIIGDAGGQIFDRNTMQQKRDWIQAQLESGGVSAADSKIRVSGMSDDQVNQVHQRMEEMPAGAGAAGAVLFVFLVLAITDLMGATDIFPFIRPMEK
jgi:hypothetical protein